jgi:hypothetical protein
MLHEYGNWSKEIEQKIIYEKIDFIEKPGICCMTCSKITWSTFLWAYYRLHPFQALHPLIYIVYWKYRPYKLSFYSFTVVPRYSQPSRLPDPLAVCQYPAYYQTIGLLQAAKYSLVTVFTPTPTPSPKYHSLPVQL